MKILLVIAVFVCGCKSPRKVTTYHSKSNMGYYEVEGKTFYDRDKAHSHAKEINENEDRNVSVKEYGPR